MGRIKTKVIKRISEEIYEQHRDELKEDFTGNKKAIEQYADIPSKKMRNIIAGYVTRLVKTKKDIIA